MTTTDGYVQRGIRSRHTDARGVRVVPTETGFDVEQVLLPESGPPISGHRVGTFYSRQRAETYARGEAARTGYTLILLDPA